MKYLPQNPEIFTQNRKRFVEKMDKNSIAILLCFYVILCTITFTAGQTTQSLNITSIYDLLAEESESKDLASKPPNIVSKIEKSWLRNIFLLLNFR